MQQRSSHLESALLQGLTQVTDRAGAALALKADDAQLQVTAQQADGYVTTPLPTIGDCLRGGQDMTALTQGPQLASSSVLTEPRRRLYWLPLCAAMEAPPCITAPSHKRLYFLPLKRKATAPLQKLRLAFQAALAGLDGHFWCPSAPHFLTSCPPQPQA